ncbi:hypothetical protein FKP32DRAFT_1670598 [Trametes sanguinea]|nr:hypothetical protein FKP32DRAFT_1670598 [Trametes sanguinea]
MTPQFIPSPSLVMILVVGTHVLLAATDVTSAAVTASLLCRSKTGSAWSMKLIRNLGVAQALQASFTALWQIVLVVTFLVSHNATTSDVLSFAQHSLYSLCLVHSLYAREYLSRQDPTTLSFSSVFTIELSRITPRPEDVKLDSASTSMPELNALPDSTTPESA